MSLSLASPLIEVRGIGPVRARQLAAVGLSAVRDLLRVLPRRYEDRRRLSLVADVDGPGPYTLRGRLSAVSRVRIRRRGLSLVRARLADASGSLPVTWFNRPYLAQQLEARREYLLHGPARPAGDGWELLNPTVEAAEGGRLAARILPVYPTLGELGPARVRHLVESVLEQADLTPDAADELPRELAERHRLPALDEAFRALHRPPIEADVTALNEGTSAAHARLAYQELLELQLELALVRRRRARRRKRHVCSLDLDRRRRLDAIPPFRLTAAQRRSFEEIAADMTSAYPMMRLLQGDVGCGKTIVAALALALAAENGLQAALMAPTELLAEQHFRSLGRFLGERYRLELLTGSATGGPAARRGLATGDAEIVVGTHALIQQSVAFRRLGLAVVDEQHRFGVSQRQRLEEKGRRPDLLVMTATPIPRSLALTVYGDLDLSVIDELPPGRQPVATRIEPRRRRRRVFEWLGEQLTEGAQAYVVCPLIERSDSIDAASIQDLEPELASRFGGVTRAVVHGGTPADERESIVGRFAAGEIRLLLATTIVEVGVDVPRATVMVIDSAERFGLAQLHQLRGRVGRGGEQSFCVALHGRLSDEARSRLRVFERTADGFEIAEADLEIRGPGDFLGTRQSGAPFLRVASLIADREWLDKARADARELVAAPPEAAGGALVEAARRRAAVLERGLAGA